MLKVEYTDTADKESKLAQYSEYDLLEVHNHTNGNFLIFDDSPFELSTKEFLLIIKELIDQLNVLRTHTAIGLSAITYQQVKDKIKDIRDNL